jgi:hypothetical protein
MFHQPPENFLYSAYKIYVEHSNGSKTKKGSATGFVIALSQEIPLIVTNRHVVDLNYKKTDSKFKEFKLSKFIITGRKPDDSQYSLRLHEIANFYFHDDYENDVILIKPMVYFDNEKIRSFHWHFGIEHLADETIFKDIFPFDLICYSGFPNTHDKFDNRPILRSGNIASDPKYNYSWDKEYQGQCIAYEGFSSVGASGSPIFAPSRGLRNISNSRHGFLIGVNAGHIPENYGHSGISYFYKSTVILDIINKHNLTTNP